MPRKQKPTKKSAEKTSSGRKSNDGKPSAKKAGAERELISTGTDTWHVPQDSERRFDSSADVGPSHSKNAGQHSKKIASKGQGPRGDQEQRGKAGKPPRIRVPRTT